jgi:mannose-1-phosphate guanylyltransferase
VGRARGDGGVLEIDAETFSGLPDVSIDHAVMERSNAVAVVPARVGWSDVGSWNAVSGLVRSDAKGNRVVGEVDLVPIEVQSGEYLGEDDIVRFEDVYGRT